MKNDLISREALKKKFEQLVDETIPYGGVAVNDMREIIDNAPTVELFCSYLSDGEVRQPCVEGPCEHDRPQGEWIISEYVDTRRGFITKCPFCKTDTIGGGNFCPNCGAKLKGGAE